MRRDISFAGSVERDEGRGLVWEQKEGLDRLRQREDKGNACLENYNEEGGRRSR